MASAWGRLLSAVHTGTSAYHELFGLPFWEDLEANPDIARGRARGGARSRHSRPEIHGTLVDLPGTVARAENLLQAAGVDERVRIVGQSFFDPRPSGADLYLLKSIFNDWPDHDARLILNRCAEAARPGGRIVILGGVSPDVRADPSC